MIAALAKPALVGLMLVASGPRMPQLDVQRTCQDTAGADGMMQCLDNERYAEMKLRKQWSRIPLSYKTQCLLNPLPPDPSYTVLRDCINNNMLIRNDAGR